MRAATGKVEKSRATSRSLAPPPRRSLSGEAGEPAAHAAAHELEGAGCGITPMPRPFSIIRHMASSPVTWMRSLHGAAGFERGLACIAT